MRISTVEQEILERLYAGPIRTTDIVGQISLTCSVSVQGVYKAIRKLRDEEVLTVYGKTVALSGVWIAQQQAKLAYAEQAYRSAPFVQEIAHTPTGSFSCTFHTLHETDLFWTNVLTQLGEHVPSTVPLYSVQPHDWYPYSRKKADNYWLRKQIESGRLSRVIITHTGPLDVCVMQLRKKALGTLFEFMLNKNPLRQKNSTYYNLIGPYLFTVEFDPKVATLLDSFVATRARLPLSDASRAEINAILSKRGTFKFSIQKSDAKMKNMELKVKKYFEF